MNFVKRWKRHPKSGAISTKEHNRRKTLVKRGLASFWNPLRNIDDAIKAAGL